MSSQEETEYVEKLRERLEGAYAIARENLRESAKRQKRYYDIKAVDEPYKPGDLVWVVNKSRRKGRGPKLQKKWLGPAVVVGKVNDVTYRLWITQRDYKVVHYDHLKPYRSTEMPEWVSKLKSRIQNAEA